MENKQPKKKKKSFVMSYMKTVFAPFVDFFSQTCMFQILKQILTLR